ncbi:MAG: helix-turn-helix transcriptional regulator [Campylobacterales bacterium]|nr:helix-turn-helix transcriptional regulator [Campylobacterales bacterium]
MEVFEKINLYLKDRKISKKEFAERLIQLEVKLKNTGSIPSENTIYAYLNGRIGIKIELIPYIAEVLNIPEQLLFDDSPRARKTFLKYILDSLSSEEKALMRSRVCEEKNTPSVPKDRYYKIQDLLVYAPEMFLSELEMTLKEYKDLTLKFRK